MVPTNRIKEVRISTRIEKPIRDTLQIYTTTENITGMFQQSATRVAKAISKPLKSSISSLTRALMTKRREKVGNSDDIQICRNMQDHQKESKRGHTETQPRDHTRNKHGIKEPEECMKTAYTRLRQTDYTHRNHRDQDHRTSTSSYTTVNRVP